MPIHDKLPHEHKQKSGSKTKALLKGLLTATAITAGFALLMARADIPITVILPTSAPIWVGITMMTFSLLEKN